MPSIINKLFAKKDTKSTASQMRAYYFSNQAIWSDRSYHKFAQEAYVKNVIAHRSISLISQAISSITLRIEGNENPALKALIKKPCHNQSMGHLMASLTSYYLISGNAYILAIGENSSYPIELHLLRPDRISIIPTNSIPSYQYKVGEHETIYRSILGQRSPVLHIKNFHPTNDYYGLSPIEAAAYSIDQHNQAGAWNQALLQNGARPSGALVVKSSDNQSGNLSEEQYQRLKEQIDNEFAGSVNAGRPILLEGGLEWREMSISPRDMDFIESKHSSARDIALAFGVPPQLLGIPGDNTYSNLAEARLALWEQTIIPLFEQIIGSMNNWLCPLHDGSKIGYDKDQIPALSPRREALWDRIGKADFLSTEEKRKILAGEDGEFA